MCIGFLWDNVIGAPVVVATGVGWVTSALAKTRRVEELFVAVLK